MAPTHPAANPAGDVARRLASVPFFASLSTADVAAIASSFTFRTCATQTVLFHEGEPPHRLFVVLAGFVKQIKHAEDGRDVILHIAMAGDLVGGVAAFGRRPHPFTAQAMTPCEVLAVAGADFARIMERHPSVARRTIDDLSVRLIDAHENLKSLAVERVEQRVARHLLRLAAQAGRTVPAGIAIEVPLTRQDVADMAGTTVETAIRVLSRWRRDGLVVDVGGCLVIQDRAALAVVAGMTAVMAAGAGAGYTGGD